MSRNSRSVFCGSTQTTGLTVVAVQFGTYREFIALQDLRMCSRFVVVDDFARNVLDVLRAVLDLRPVTVSPDQSAAATSFHRRLQPKPITSNLSPTDETRFSYNTINQST